MEGYTHVRKEVKFQDSRLDIYAEKEGELCFVEVKNVTLRENEMALFPDAVTTRGQKHLNTLMVLKEQGYRAVMLYIIQRMDVKAFGPAEDIDPQYAHLLKTAYKKGVEIIPLQVKVSPRQIELEKILPLKL